MLPSRLRSLALATLVPTLTGGCDVPTALPRWDTRWVLIGAADTIATADLLPPGVTVDGAGFAVDTTRLSGSVRLGDVCELCTCFEGPIPRVDFGPHDWAVPVPGGLTAAHLSGGSARVVLWNRAGFDLLEAGGELGSVTVELRDLRSDALLRTLTLAEPFPPGDSLSLVFDLADLELSPWLVARIRGTTPGSGCEDVQLTPESGIDADVVLGGVRAWSVEVFVSDGALAVAPRVVDLPEAVSSRLRPGEARVVVEVEVESTAPVGVEMLLSVASTPDRLFGPEAALYTPLPVPPGAPGAPVRVSKRYLLDVADLQGAGAVHVATRNSVAGERRIRLRGQERVAYRVVLDAEIPSR